MLAVFGWILLSLLLIFLRDHDDLDGRMHPRTAETVAATPAIVTWGGQYNVMLQNTNDTSILAIIGILGKPLIL